MRSLRTRFLWLNRFRRRRVGPPVHVLGRRRLFAQGAALLALGAGLGLQLWKSALAALPSPFRAPVRPPTADPDDSVFQAACIRCGLCGTVCENGCIRYLAADEPSWGGLTPYLDVRERSCTLCMRCTDVCPSGALSRVEPDLEVVARVVRMGTAVVDPDRCISYLGRVCGYCHDACPLPGRAIKLVPPAKPVVIADACVGCGRCVEQCPQSPTAIDVWRLDVRRTA